MTEEQADMKVKRLLTGAIYSFLLELTFFKFASNSDRFNPLQISCYQKLFTPNCYFNFLSQFTTLH